MWSSRTSVWGWGVNPMVELPIEASSPMISDVMSVPMAFMIRRAPPGCRFAKDETSKTAPSTITQARPFKI